MSDVIIGKANEAFAKISCERYIAKELSEYFTFFVPGHTFSPAFKNKIWDGKIRLFNLSTFQIYMGLVSYIEEFCNDRGYTFEYHPSCQSVEDEFSVYHFEKFVKGLNLSSAGRKITPDKHQQDAVIHVMQGRRALLISPTASGKSLIIYLIFRQLLDYQNLRGLIVVPTTSLVEQLYSDFVDYASESDFDVSQHVHRIYQGKDKNTDKDLIITTWQSVYQMPDEYFSQFDYVIGDEAHLFKADSLIGILTKCTETKYRVGLTGTLDGTKTHQLVLEGLFGRMLRVTTTKELIDKGRLSGFTIKCLILKHPEEDCVKREYKDEIQYLISNHQRNKFIKNLAVSMKKNTLVLFQMVDKHGVILYNMIKETKDLGDRKVFFVSGKTETEDREEIRRIVENEENAIIVASYGTYSTGINIRNLHNIIFASPYKSKTKVLQSIGRGLRKSDNKDEAVLYDIADDMRYGKNMNHTLKHFVERTKFYTEEKHSYKIYKIGLKK